MIVWYLDHVYSQWLLPPNAIGCIPVVPSRSVDDVQRSTMLDYASKRHSNLCETELDIFASKRHFRVRDKALESSQREIQSLPLLHE